MFSYYNIMCVTYCIYIYVCVYVICVDAEHTLDNIIICRVFTHEEQMGQNYDHTLVHIAYILISSYNIRVYMLVCL